MKNDLVDLFSEAEFEYARKYPPIHQSVQTVDGGQPEVILRSRPSEIWADPPEERTEGAAKFWSPFATARTHRSSQPRQIRRGPLFEGCRLRC